MIRTNSPNNDELREILGLLEQEQTHGASESLDETPALGDSTATFPPIDTARIERCLARLAEYREHLQQDKETQEEEAEAEAAPRLIDRFTIVSELGRGGCGVVFLARDPDLNRLVALKVPHPAALVSSELRRRFVVEARASASLEHPAIIRVYEVGSSGVLSWIAAEYCNGCTLQAYLEKNQLRIAPRVAAETIRRLAEAIDYAHRRGVLHRDLKPANILLAPRAIPSATVGPVPSIELADCDPKLTDFGLAKILTESTTATMTMLPMGTPAYMAPEQIAGNSAEIGTGCDIYSLGIILYELLAGTPAYRGASREEIWKRIIHDDLPPISKFRQDVPRDLEAIVAKVTEKSPAARYRTAGELAEDLGRFLDGEPTVARPLSGLVRAQRWVRRHPAGSGILATLVLAAGLLIGGGVWHLRAIEEELRINRQLRSVSQSQLASLRHTEYLGKIRQTRVALDEFKLEQAVLLLKECLPLSGEPDQRDFAWHHLWQRCHTELLRLTHHRGPVSALAYSPDGKLLATGSHDGTIALCDSINGKVSTTLSGHQGNINCLAFTKRDNRLITGADDGRLIVWDMATKKELRKIACHDGDLLCLALHPTQSWIATSGCDGILRVWNYDTGEMLHELLGDPYWIRGVAFSIEGDRLFSTGHDCKVRCWDFASGDVIWTSDYVNSKFHALAISPEGRYVFVGGHTGIIYQYNTSDGSRHDLVDSKIPWIRAMCICPQTNRLTVVGQSGRARMWDLNRGSKTPDNDLNQPSILDLAAHAPGIWSLAFAPNGQRFATGAFDHTVKIWDNKNLQSQQGYDEIKFESMGATQDLQLFPERGELRYLSAGGWMEFQYDKLESTQLTHTWVDFLNNGFLLPDRQRAVLGFLNQSLEVRSIPDNQLLQKLPIELSEQGKMELHPNGDWIGVMAVGEKFRLWSLAEKRFIAEYDVGEVERVTCVKFSPDGTLVALQIQGANSKSLEQVFDLKQPSRKLSFKGYKAETAFSPDGKLFAVVHPDGTIHIHQAKDFQEIRHLTGIAANPTALVFTPDSRSLAVGYEMGPVQLWDVETGLAGLELPGTQEGRTEQICFTQDMSRLVIVRHTARKVVFATYYTDRVPAPN